MTTVDHNRMSAVGLEPFDSSGDWHRETFALCVKST